jgi:methionyl-tRNA formyltransferase
MIQLIGHNEIVVNLSKTLRENDIPFKVYSNKDMPEIGVEYANVPTLVDLKDKLLQYANTTLILSAGAPWIFHTEFLASFDPIGIFNIHGTPLPHDRGGTIVSWLILNKKRIGNAIIHKIVKDPDAGPILMNREFIYPIHCQLPADYLNEYNRQQEITATDLCLQWSKGEVDLRNVSHQPHYLATYWPRLQASLNAWIDWSWAGEDIALFIRAFDEPYAGAKTLWRGKTLNIKSAFFQTDSNFHPFQWGLVYRYSHMGDSTYYAIAVQGGSLYIEVCVDENAMSMMGSIKEGDRFYTTDEKLTIAKRRTIKTKNGFASQDDLL